MNSNLYKEIGRASKKADANDLVSKNLKYAVKLASKPQYRGHGLELEELIDEAVIGLCDAAKRYNPEKNDAFLGFAQMYIDGYLKNALKMKGNTVRISTSQLKRGETSNSESIDQSLYRIADESEISDEEKKTELLIDLVNKLQGPAKTIMEIKLKLGQYHKDNNKYSIEKIAKIVSLTPAKTRQIFLKTKEDLTMEVAKRF